MINIIDKKECCGCTACICICPKQCISMKEDEEGFLYPNVDEDSCINCNLCTKICPVLNVQKEKENPEQKAFIAAHKNESILQESTSGGAFTAIAEYVIKQGGIVYGVEMKSDYSVHHVGVDKIQDLYRFRNSKYVQSDLENTFKNAKEFLDNGRMVCFSGTPCQIEGFSNYLGKEYNNLILVDVVCRAVPSPGVWRKYVKYLVDENGKIKNIRFRDKSLGYQYSTMKIEYENNIIAREGIESDLWLRMFFSGMIIRPSCTKCRFRKRYRKSDFTIWDAFNVSDISSSFDQTKGATKVLVHTARGEKILEELKGDLKYEMVSPDVLVEGMRELSISPQLNCRRKEFFDDFKCTDMKTLLNKYFPITIKVKVKKYARRCLNKVGLDVWIKKIKRKLFG